jgi:hypothetical protein
VSVRRITADDYDVVGDMHGRAFALPAGPRREHVENLCLEPEGCLLALASNGNYEWEYLGLTS